MSSRRDEFLTTRWSQVAAAARWVPGSPEREDAKASRDAMDALCRAYWRPLYAFARKHGLARDVAADRVQGYFARVLEKNVLAETAPERGRLRAFLRASFRNYLANAADHERAEKRGGGRDLVAIDAEPGDEVELALADLDTPERCFERAWALAVLDRALDRLAAEEARARKTAAFERMRPFLTDPDGAVEHAELARALGTTEGAVRVAVHRLRRRYGELLRDEAARTLADEREVDDELRALLAALGR